MRLELVPLPVDLPFGAIFLARAGCFTGEAAVVQFCTLMTSRVLRWVPGTSACAAAGAIVETPFAVGA